LNIPLVDLKAQYQSIKPDVDAAIHRILDNTAFILGKEVESFEEAFASYMDCKHAIGVSNGTEALLLPLVALGVGAGDEVITTPHTFIATVEPIVQVGAKPVFVDIDPLTYNIDPDQIESAITERTKAIIPVHLYGQPANMPAIKAVADRHNIPIIEDAAQAHGAEYAGNRVGSWGVMTGFSFYPGKNLGAYGDAGAIITNDNNLAQKLRILRDHGSATKYEHVEIGYNARIDAMQAAILSVKLRQIEAWTERRRQHASAYTQALASLPGVITPAEDANARHVYHLYVIRIPGDRNTTLEHLKDSGIGAGIHYPVPVHLQPALRFLGHKEGDFPNAESAARSIVSLPLYPELTAQQIDAVVNAVGDYVGLLNRVS
jgi:dTDP-4-amino-4,6-dideoxygalactose transaminase